jgi:hypothetical protein
VTCCAMAMRASTPWQWRADSTHRKPLPKLARDAIPPLPPARDWVRLGSFEKILG